MNLIVCLTGPGAADWAALGRSLKMGNCSLSFHLECREAKAGCARSSPLCRYGGVDSLCSFPQNSFRDTWLLTLKLWTCQTCQVRRAQLSSLRPQTHLLNHTCRSIVHIYHNTPGCIKHVACSSRLMNPSSPWFCHYSLFCLIRRQPVCLCELHLNYTARTVGRTAVTNEDALK